MDGVAYEDELDDKVAVLREDDEAVDQLEVEDYRQSRGYGSSGFSLGGRPRVAVLYAVGTIVSGRGGFDATDGALVGSDSFVEEIRRIKDDSSIRAVVLRIDSPGGSSVASDVIWRELTLLREDNPSRPLIVSMGDLAASGGYYIATPADEIVAQPSTLTGSIGIYVGKFALGQGLDEAGRHDAGRDGRPNADIYSPFTPFTPASSGRVCRRSCDDFYKGFVAKVAESRKKTAEEIDAVAQGRVWTGAQARERGLVDRLGGLDVAIAAAKERAGIDAGRRGGGGGLPAPPHGLRGVLGSVRRRGAAAGMLGALLGRAPARAVAAATAPGAAVPPRRAAGADAVCVRSMKSLGLRPAGFGRIRYQGDRLARPGRDAHARPAACWLRRAARPAWARCRIPPIREGATVKLGPHTYAIPDFSVPLVPNVGIVVGNRATLVVDTGLGRRNGEAILREVAKVSKNTELYIVTTHFHAEHTMGYMAFPPSAKYVNAKQQEADFDEGGLRQVQGFAGLLAR